MKFTNSVNYIRLINFVVESILEFLFSCVITFLRGFNYTLVTVSMMLLLFDLL